MGIEVAVRMGIEVAIGVGARSDPPSGLCVTEAKDGAMCFGIITGTHRDGDTRRVTEKTSAELREFKR